MERLMHKLLLSRKRDLTARIEQMRGWIAETEIDLQEVEEMLAGRPLPTHAADSGLQVTPEHPYTSGAHAAAEIEGATADTPHQPKRGRGRPPKAAPAPESAPAVAAPTEEEGEDDEDNTDPGEPPVFNRDGTPF